MADDPKNVAASGGNGAVHRVVRNPAGQLVAHIRGREAPVVDARIARCFPWSVPEAYVSIRDKDGKEVALLETLDGLDADSRAVVQEELREKNFNPKILKFLDYRTEFGVTLIEAQTDRGHVSFQIRNRDDVRMLSSTRALFRDVDGNTYELPDVRALDPASRKRVQECF